MIRLGAKPPDMREMFIDDIFLGRLKLLIIMTKAYLHGYPLGRYRCSAITSNAQIIKNEAIGLGDLDEPGTSHFTTVSISDSEKKFMKPSGRWPKPHLNLHPAMKRICQNGKN